MTKFVFPILLLLFTALQASGQSTCLPNGITFSSAQEIADFPSNYPGCTVIEGPVTIYTQGTDLHGLEAVTAIGSSLYIGNEVTPNSFLTTLQGLNNLKSIGESFYLSNNPALNSLEGLDKLEKVGVHFSIVKDSALTNLTGLDSLKVVGGNFGIGSNPALLHIDGFNHLDSVGGIFGIGSNEALLDINGFIRLTTVNNIFSIQNNDSLKSFTGFKNLATIGRSFYVIDNLILKHLPDLGKIKSVGLDVVIDRNASLLSLEGLDSLQSISDQLVVHNNNSLGNLQGLGRLQAVKSMVIYTNSTLTSLDGLGPVQPKYSVHLLDNPLLTDVSALSSVHELGASLIINKSNSLTNLHGLEQLTKIADYVEITANPLLTDLSALSNVDSIGGYLLVQNNALLSDCAIYPICEQLNNHPERVTIMNNAPGCNTAVEVASNCGKRLVVVQVLVDADGDCQADTANSPAEGTWVQLSGDQHTLTRATSATGLTQFKYLGTDAFTLSLPQYPNQDWAVCPDTLSFSASTSMDTVYATFFLKPLKACPKLDVHLALPTFFRGCLVSSNLQVVTRNVGTLSAENVHVAVVLPAELELISSTPAWQTQSGDTLFFEFGDLSPFMNGTVNMVVKTNCTAPLVGRTLCLEAFAGLTNPCPTTPVSFSEIKLSSQCLNDTTVRFTLENVEDAPTLFPHEYRIFKNAGLLTTQSFSLLAHQSLNVDLPADGSTYRMEATKFNGGTLTATARENCGGLAPGFITAFWLDKGGSGYDFDCREVQVAYDPNEKTAVPTGVGPQHLLAKNKPLQYTIDFQNTGTDTAFRVLLRDVLSPPLNVNTFRPGYASHPYTWQIVDGNELEVLFQPIMLPDSNGNEAASHGWFSFEIDQKPDLPDGTFIENTASIIFDYNPPILTNLVFHVIGELTVSVDEPPAAGQVWQVLGNPARYAATFRSVEVVPGVKRFELSDALGRVVRTEHFDGQEFVFRRNLLSGGLYYFRIYNAQGQVVSGKIILTD